MLVNRQYTRQRILVVLVKSDRRAVSRAIPEARARPLRQPLHHPTCSDRSSQLERQQRFATTSSAFSILSSGLRKSPVTPAEHRRHVWSAAQRQERDQGLLLGPGQGAKWYACGWREQCGMEQQLTMLRSHLQ